VGEAGNAVLLSPLKGEAGKAVLLSLLKGELAMPSSSPP
jgi:hypothetical protein